MPSTRQKVKYKDFEVCLNYSYNKYINPHSEPFISRLQKSCVKLVQHFKKCLDAEHVSCISRTQEGNIAIMEQDSQARTEREHMEDRLVGSTYQPGGVSTTKRAGYGETRDAETRYRLAVLDSRGKSARGCVDGRQTRRRIEGGRYEDGRQEGCTMPVDIQSPQLNPTQISQDQPALGVSSGAVADGAWAYHAREDDSFPRWEHGREEYDRSRSDVVGQTERSGMAAPGCFQGKYTDPRTPNSHDGTNSQNAWG